MGNFFQNYSPQVSLLDDFFGTLLTTGNCGAKKASVEKNVCNGGANVKVLTRGVSPIMIGYINNYSKEEWTLTLLCFV